MRWLLAGIFVLSLPASAAELAGKPRIVDGDTLDLAGKKIRLFGIDAPEGKQTCTLDGKAWACGIEARDALARLIDGKPITCQQRDIDRYKRIVAVCHVEGLDLNGAMVRQGWALAYRRYSRAYVEAEDEARLAVVGIWRAKVTEPWEWRQSR